MEPPPPRSQCKSCSDIKLDEGQTTVACVPVMSVCVPVFNTALCGHDALHLCEQSVVVPLNLLRTFSLNLRNEIVVAIKPHPHAVSIPKLFPPTSLHNFVYRVSNSPSLIRRNRNEEYFGLV